MVEIEASKLILYHAASLFDSGNPKLLPEMALWKAACTAVMAADESVMLQEGLYNYKEDFKVEIFRDITELKHRNPKNSSIYDIKSSNLYYPFTRIFLHKTYRTYYSRVQLNIRASIKYNEKYL